MNKELQQYYENRFGMMATQGWTDLIEDVELMIKSTDTISGVETTEQLHFRKGELSIMNWLKTLRESSSGIYEQLQEETEDA
jgi:hypothetical protein